MNATNTQDLKKSTKTYFEPLIWRSELSLNNEELDAQHQQLFNLTNELIKHADADAHSEIINETLYELLQYIDVHFSDEEKMLEELNYPKLAEHKRAHRNFTKKIARFCQDVVLGKSHIAEHLLTFLSTWIMQHTGFDDQDFKKYI